MECKSCFTKNGYKFMASFFIKNVFRWIFIFIRSIPLNDKNIIYNSIYFKIIFTKKNGKLI